MNNTELFTTQSPSPRFDWRRGLKTCPKSLGLVTLVLVIPWLIPGYFSAPVVFNTCFIRQPLFTVAGNNFSVSRFETTEGANIPDGGKVCFQDKLSSHMSGTATPVAGTKLRLFQMGNRGELYIHEPPLEIKNGQWNTGNIGSGSNLREMRFVRVSESSSATLSQRAARNDWGPVTLDADAQKVASFGLAPDPVCVKFDARECFKNSR